MPPSEQGMGGAVTMGAGGQGSPFIGGGGGCFIVGGATGLATHGAGAGTGAGAGAGAGAGGLVGQGAGTGAGCMGFHDACAGGGLAGMELSGCHTMGLAATEEYCLITKYDPQMKSSHPNQSVHLTFMVMPSIADM